MAEISLGRVGPPTGSNTTRAPFAVRDLHYFGNEIPFLGGDHMLGAGIEQPLALGARAGQRDGGRTNEVSMVARATLLDAAGMITASSAVSFASSMSAP
jgi:hypothetical protein